MDSFYYLNVQSLPKKGKFRGDLEALIIDDQQSGGPSRSTKRLDVCALQKLWDDFQYLMSVLEIQPGNQGYLEAQEFAEKACEWATHFRLHTFDEDVTPYIHG